MENQKFAANSKGIVDVLASVDSISEEYVNAKLKNEMEQDVLLSVSDVSDEYVQAKLKN